MRQIYATLVECDSCGATDSYIPPETARSQPDSPEGWIGPVVIAHPRDPSLMRDLCPQCARLPLADAMDRIAARDQHLREHRDPL